ncbi:ATP-binding cassette domain-containing protein [Micromonospora echinospora]|uniref:ATP-binding cassette domain-containing protein n=1 Tax=Micromonospora echinospora TaxID=1877 RepID=UPI003A84A3AC
MSHRTRGKALARSVAALLTVTLAVAACGGGDEAGNGEPADPIAGRPTPTDQAPDSETKIAMIGFANNPYWVSVKSGADYADRVLSDKNGKVDWIVAGDNIDVQTVSSAIRAADAQGYKGVGFFIAGEGNCADIKTLSAKGIKMGAYNTLFDCVADSGGTINYAQEQYKAGQTAAQEMIKAAGDKAGKVGIIVSQFTAPGSEQRRQVFLDEPNSSLTHEESERLFAVMSRLRDEGVAVVLVSHRLAEVYSIVDNVIVLRDGTFVAAGPPDEIHQQRAVALMAGERKRAVVAEVVADRADTIAGAEVALELEGLTGDGFTDVSFTVRRGEIVGMSGLVGAGRTEIAEAVIGLRTPTRGGIRVAGRPVRIPGPGRAQRLGLAYVAEERRTEVFHAKSVGYNLTVRVLSSLGRLGWVSPRRTNAKARELTERFGVKAASSEALITSLSGGNQQKVLLARALAARPKVLILDEPTRGVDVGTKAEIYATLRALAHEEGLAVWFISSELEEVVELADRVVVVRNGRVTLDAPNNAGPQPIVAAAMGATEGTT